MESIPNLYLYMIYIVGIRDSNSDRGIGSWATPEDTKEPEDNQVLIRANGLLGQGRGLITASR